MYAFSSALDVLTPLAIWPSRASFFERSRRQITISRGFYLNVSNLKLWAMRYQAACLWSVISPSLVTMVCTAFSCHYVLFAFYFKLLKRLYHILLEKKRFFFRSWNTNISKKLYLNSIHSFDALSWVFRNKTCTYDRNFCTMSYKFSTIRPKMFLIPSNNHYKRKWLLKINERFNINKA